ncbi:MAG: acetyltransferase [Deltaproteobacteria bacterium]|nr:acetyltransferase [Deltaproteobacteria bacterium]
MKIGKRNLWIRLILLGIALIVVIQVVRYIFREEERRTRIYIREAIKKKYPQAVNQLKATHGLRPFEQPIPSLKPDAHKSEVILLHGLDDPGKIWMNLAPVLVNAGFHVLIMTYPNDQPITESAQFFLKQIESYMVSGTGSISIVAHSMGGLVAREMLTNPALFYTEKVDKGELPAVERLIMVGTPNHGSGLAQFRIFTEFRDQLSNLFNENYHWLQGILDGAGEAGIDLIPGSKFLKKLNRRPHPYNVNMLVIAGVMSPWQKNEIEEFARTLEVKLPGDARGTAKKMENVLLSMSDEIGDGLVSVDSARLPDVPIRIVKGTHLSMIRNIRAGSQRIPPAIPIIIKQLNRSVPKN